MTSIDELFASRGLAPGQKRKLDSQFDPQALYKSTKVAVNGDAKGKQHATTVEDDLDEDGDGEYGVAPPPDLDEEEDDEEGRFFGGGVNKNTEEAMRYLDARDEEEDDAAEPEVIDSAWLRRLGLSFEKKISKNAELRSKFESDPQKFMASEADLDAEITTLSMLASHPELYEEFAKIGCAQSLVSLLAHENTDIAIDAIEILAELTDEDVDAEPEQWDAIVNAFLESDLLGLLLSNFGRFDEESEADRNGVYHSMNVLENLASQRGVSDKIGEEVRLLKWLLDRAKKKESSMSQNKQYAAELLAILLQSSISTRNQLTSMEGDAVDTILQLLAPYRKNDPEKDSAEEEYAGNLFDALTWLVHESAGKEKFLEAEGVELCLIMLRKARFGKPRALKILDHAAEGSAGRSACERIVEAAGLKTLFAMFMNPKAGRENTEHLLGIFGSLMRSLPSESPARIRALAKFVENDYEKVKRLVELREKYVTQIAAVDREIEQEDDPDDERMAEFFLRRVDAGLYCLQTVDTILAWLIAEDDGAMAQIVKLLKEQDASIKDVKATLQEQADGIEGEDDDVDVKDMLQALIECLP